MGTDPILRLYFGSGISSSTEKDSRHAVIIVLAGMDDDLGDGWGIKCHAVAGSNGAGYRGGFNELRPGTDDGGNFHLIAIILR